MTPLADRWAEVCWNWEVNGYSSLSHLERTWLNIRGLIDSIENGGLISYFYNSPADNLQDCLRALEELGALDVRQQVERVCGLFPGGVPAGIDERNEVIDSWPDSESTDAFLREVDDWLMPVMPRLEERLERFLRRSGVQ